MTETLKECVWFYTGADYLVINAFLWKNRDALDPCIEIVWQNNTGMIREAKKDPGEFFSSSGLDGAALYRSYIKRTPPELNADSKKAMLDQAISDLRLICRSMRPADGPERLIRNMERAFVLKDVRVGEEVELCGLTSTSTTGQKIDYGVQDLRQPAQILYIDIPAGTPALFLNNDEHEVLLPPMRYRATDIGSSCGVPTVTLEALSPLDAEILIRSAKESFPEYFRDRQREWIFKRDRNEPFERI
ncbi:MAG: hypothetical protein J5854_05235 [Clostridia bacterium]|nr:hypothetical protein [Clostridia bacterium]